MKVFFDITNRCNANCLYCFTNSNSIVDDKELSMDEIINVINMLIENDISKISIAGGEPFLKDVYKIMKYCDKKIPVSFTTNGTIINNKILEGLKTTDSKITISIDSLHQDTINKVRNGIDIKTVIKNITLLSSIPEINKNLSLRATVSVANMYDIEELIDFCNHLNIKKLKINSTNPFGRAINHKELIPEFKKFETLFQRIYDYSKKNSPNTIIEIPVMKYLTKEKKQCLLGKNSIYIDSKGNVYPCAFSEGKLSVGNVRNEKLKILIDKCINSDKNNDICVQCEIHRYEN